MEDSWNLNVELPSQREDLHRPVGIVSMFECCWDEADTVVNKQTGKDEHSLPLCETIEQESCVIGREEVGSRRICSSKTYESLVFVIDLGGLQLGF
jgi:hypothetical protein